MSFEHFPSEQLTFVTTRIECGLTDGTTSVGTGFFFEFPRGDGKCVPTLVTNRHVIAGSSTLKIRFTARADDGSPRYGDRLEFDLNFGEAKWAPHPDPEVDLAFLPMAGFLAELQAQGRTPFYVALRPDNLPTAAEMGDLGAIEDVVMVGYPIGLWDEANNLPIVRSGITATHPARDFNGQKRFVIDVACFPGSSGSPVFLYNQFGYTTRKHSLVMGESRIRFLGVLFAAPMHTADGEIRVIDVPTQRRAVTQAQIPMNLGYVIKAERILEFDAVIRTLEAAAPGPRIS